MVLTRPRRVSVRRWVAQQRPRVVYGADVNGNRRLDLLLPGVVVMVTLERHPVVELWAMHGKRGPLVSFSSPEVYPEEELLVADVPIDRLDPWTRAQAQAFVEDDDVPPPRLSSGQIRHLASRVERIGEDGEWVVVDFDEGNLTGATSHR